MLKQRTVATGLTLVMWAGLVSCASAQTDHLARLEQTLEALQRRYAIPGMSAGIATSGNGVLWSHGFGVADRERAIPATPETVFQLASLTKPFASTVILQLVREGRLSLDEPVSRYGITMPNADNIHVRHLLSHTSEGTPGTQFRYNGDRFAALDAVIQQASGQPFGRAVTDRVIRRLSLQHTGPGQLARAAALGLDSAALRSALAQGYSSDGTTAIAYPAHFSAAAGMISTVYDVLAFSVALDGDVLLNRASRTLAFTPTVTPAGNTLPYGLGWFTTRNRGHDLVWHYGYWTGNSSLIIKVPARGITFVLLANSDGLSRPFRLGSGDLESSPFAVAFLDWLERSAEISGRYSSIPR
jgi:CubicO group peptidase (beta-lactamase class C family)